MGKTSSKVKERYNAKVYDKITVRLPKELVASFKAKCAAEGTSQAQIIREAIEAYLNK
jgi:predicted DNA-binding protein